MALMFFDLPDELRKVVVHVCDPSSRLALAFANKALHKAIYADEFYYKPSFNEFIASDAAVGSIGLLDWAFSIAKPSKTLGHSKSPFLAVDPVCLREAARLGHLDTIKYLIAKGVRLNESPLIAACSAGHRDVMEFLLPLTPRVRPKDVAAHVALSGRIDSLEWLKNNGFIITKAAVSFAARSGSVECFDWVCDKAGVKNDLASSASSLVSMTLKEGHLQMFEHLRNRGYAMKPEFIHLAAESGNVSLVKRFLEISPEAESLLADAFPSAVASGSEEMVRLFLGKGLKISVACDDAISEARNKEFIEFLIEFGAKLPENFSHMFITEILSLDDFSWLVKIGGKIDETFFHRSVQLHKNFLAKHLVLKKFQLINDITVRIAASSGNIEFLKFAIANGIDVRPTHIYHAAYDCRYNVIKWAVEDLKFDFDPSIIFDPHKDLELSLADLPNRQSSPSSYSSPSVIYHYPTDLFIGKSLELLYKSKLLELSDDIFYTSAKKYSMSAMSWLISKNCPKDLNGFLLHGLQSFPERSQRYPYLNALEFLITNGYELSAELEQYATPIRQVIESKKIRAEMDQFIDDD